MIGVVIIPTGITADIGGHAGDANPVAKLIGECCDKLILHPNVVNASDINEMPSNSLYVEGSILDRFLEGEVSLREVRKQNKILVVANSPLKNETVNAVSAARSTVGIDAEIVELDVPLVMESRIEDGLATGDVYGWEELVSQLSNYTFDAVAIHTPIKVPRELSLNYFRNGGVNPWGGIEAITSKLIANALNKPVAHAPLENVTADDNELYFIFEKEVDPRTASEAISTCYLHCVLKGLNMAPQIGNGISVDDIDFMISPYGCVGRPHEACLKNGIPVIVVEENKTILNDEMPKEFLIVNNYLEAAGVVMSMKAGIDFKSVRRPLAYTNVKRSKK